jgi:hypothetical protein
LRWLGLSLSVKTHFHLFAFQFAITWMCLLVGHLFVGIFA